jgi:capsid protein
MMAARTAIQRVTARRVVGGRGSMAITARGSRGLTPRNEYEATKDSHRRKAPTANTKAEDAVLCKSSRQKLSGGAKDLRRNFADAAWAVRKHLDFVSTFTFQARTDDTGLDKDIELWIAERSRRHNCDVAARHPLRRMIRIAEACRTIDGDSFWLKLADGRIQGIEGDRIQTARDLPAGYTPEEFTHGVRTNASGRAMEYCICKRATNTGLVFDKMVPAKWIWSHGYYDRYDQIRGVTPLSTSLNNFRDLHEGRGYALARMKVSQLFGLVIFREKADPLGQIVEGDADGAEPRDYRKEINFDLGPQILDLDPMDRAEFLENKTPSVEFQQFDTVILASALKSLDIPLSFYNEAHTNFFGSKGALQQYLFSANIKRGDVAELLDDWTSWQLGLAIADGDLRLPMGMTWADIGWQWVPAGLPWWKPLEEVKAYVEAIKAGLTSTPRACLERGDDAYEIAAEEAKYRTMRAALAKEVAAAGGSMDDGGGDDAGEDDDDDTTLADALAKELMTGEQANV